MCKDGTGASIGTVNGMTATLASLQAVPDGQKAITCVFTNTKQGSIITDKVTVPAR